MDGELEQAFPCDCGMDDCKARASVTMLHGGKVLIDVSHDADEDTSMSAIISTDNLMDFLMRARITEDMRRERREW